MVIILAKLRNQGILFEKIQGFVSLRHYILPHLISNDKLYSIQKDIDLPFDEFHIHDGANSKCHLALSDGIIDFNKFKDLLKTNDSYVVLEVKQASDLVKSVPIFKELIK